MNSNMSTINTTYSSESEVSAAKKEQTYSLTLSADQRKLLMYTGTAIGGYLLVRHFIGMAKRDRD